MAGLFGLHPWDIKRLTVPQLREYHDAIVARLNTDDQQEG